MLVKNLIQSPLNYTGGKYRLLKQILPHFPDTIDSFVDLFCGGCNVGLNVKAERVLFNDSNPHLRYLYNTFKSLEKQMTFQIIDRIIEEYGLSRSTENGYDFYGCDSSKGLGKYNREPFLKLRDDFNKSTIDSNYYIMATSENLAKPPQI